MLRLPFFSCVRRFSVKEKLSWNVLNLKERGLIQVLLPTDSENYFVGTHNGPRTFYCGFDPTAPSLHLGNLTALMLLLQVQRRGHSVVALVGGATAIIGDPSGRERDRDSMEDDQLIENSTHVTNTLQRLFENHERMLKHHKFFTGTLGSWEVMDNASWNADMSAVDLAVNVARYLRLGDFLSKESVKQRMDSDQGMNLKEFMYPMFQANDWLRLFLQRDCVTQIGGNDQQGNIDIGLKLIHKVTRKNAFGLTVPLLTRKDGSKIGKSDNNTEIIWLSPEKTNPFEFYQHLVRTQDADVEHFLKIFTFLPLSQIEQIMQRHWASPELRKAQEVLAKEVTLLVHGDEGLKTAQVATDIVFPSKDSQDRTNGLKGINKSIAKQLNIPVIQVTLEPNLSLFSLVMKTAAVPTEMEALQFIRQGSVSINHRTITSSMEVIRYDAHITPENFSLLRIGKRKFFLVQWTD